jgi:membrane protein
LWEWFKETYIHFFSKDNCPLMAAAISFYAILSLIPLFLLLISLLGFVLHSSEKASSSAYYLLVKTFPLSTASSFKLLFHLVQKRGVFGFFGLLGLTWAASRIFSVIEQALNIVWKVAKGRRYFHSKLLSVILVPISLLIIILSLGVTSLYAFAKNQTLPLLHFRLSDAPFIANLLTILIPILLSLLLFFLLYKFIPYRRISNSVAFAGAISASFLWEISKNLFDIYIKNYAGVEKIYGSFGAIVILFFWIYYSAFILLIGAEVGVNFEILRGKNKVEGMAESSD